MKKPIIPTNLTKECQKLAPFQGSTMGDLLADAAETAKIYNECRIKHKRLKEFVDKIGK